MKWFLRKMAWFWNPWKIRDKDGRIILDIKGRKRSRMIQRQERREAKCYKVGLKNSIGFTGTTR